MHSMEYEFKYKDLVTEISVIIKGKSHEHKEVEILFESLKVVVNDVLQAYESKRELFIGRDVSVIWKPKIDN